MTTLTKAAPGIKPYFIANLSPYTTYEHTTSVIDKLLEDSSTASQQHFIAAPYATIVHLIEKYKKSGLIFGTDSMLNISEGSFTEPIAARMIKEANASFVLLRSFDPNQPQKSSENTLPKKIKVLLQEGLTPFVCIGETLEQYEKGSSKQILTEQIRNALQDLTPHQLLNLNIIYEAPWINLVSYRPDLDQLVASYRLSREVLQEQIDIQIAKGLRLICGVPYDFEDLPSLMKVGSSNGFYLAKAILHPNQLHRIFATDLSLHGEFEQPELEELIHPAKVAAPAVAAALEAGLAEVKPVAVKEKEEVIEKKLEEKAEEEKGEEEKTEEAEAAAVGVEEPGVEEGPTDQDEYFEIVQKGEEGQTAIEEKFVPPGKSGTAPAAVSLAEEEAFQPSTAEEEIDKEVEKELEAAEGEIPEEEETEPPEEKSHDPDKKTIRVADITKNIKGEDSQTQK